MRKKNSLVRTVHISNNYLILPTLHRKSLIYTRYEHVRRIYKDVRTYQRHMVQTIFKHNSRRVLGHFRILFDFEHVGAVDV